MTGKAGAELTHPYPERGDRDFSLGIKLSLIVHLAALTLLLLKGAIFPDDPFAALPPVLRVDVVGLPDLQKQERVVLPKGQIEEPKEETATPPKTQEKPVEEVADKDELVHQPKPKEQAKEKEKTKPSEKPVDRKKKLSSALDRIKALNRIEGEVEDEGVVIKGNRVSHGTSTAPDAREGGEAGYLDILRDHLAEKWQLPPWLARQGFSASVQLHIDGRGKISSFRFVKASGNQQFDDQIQRTLKNSEPYPIPPGHLSASLLRRGVLVRFPL